MMMRDIADVDVVQLWKDDAPHIAYDDMFFYYNRAGDLDFIEKKSSRANPADSIADVGYLRKLDHVGIRFIPEWMEPPPRD